MLSLPVNLLLTCASYLNNKDFINLSSICKDLRQKCQKLLNMRHHKFFENVGDFNYYKMFTPNILSLILVQNYIKFDINLNYVRKILSSLKNKRILLDFLLRSDDIEALRKFDEMFDYDHNSDITNFENDCTHATTLNWAFQGNAVKIAEYLLSKNNYAVYVNCCHPCGDNFIDGIAVEMSPVAQACYYNNLELFKLAEKTPIYHANKSVWKPPFQKVKLFNLVRGEFVKNGNMELFDYICENHEITYDYDNDIIDIIDLEDIKSIRHVYKSLNIVMDDDLLKHTRDLLKDYFEVGEELIKKVDKIFN